MRSLQLLISDEIGYGLVPIDDFEREYREFHGRVMTELAEQGGLCGTNCVWDSAENKVKGN